MPDSATDVIPVSPPWWSLCGDVSGRAWLNPSRRRDRWSRSSRGSQSVRKPVPESWERLTLEVWCYLQTCHLPPPPSPNMPWNNLVACLHWLENRWENLWGFIFGVICCLSPLRSHVVWLCKWKLWISESSWNNTGKAAGRRRTKVRGHVTLWAIFYMQWERILDR